MSDDATLDNTQRSYFVHAFRAGLLGTTFFFVGGMSTIIEISMGNIQVATSFFGFGSGEEANSGGIYFRPSIWAAIAAQIVFAAGLIWMAWKASLSMDSWYTVCQRSGLISVVISSVALGWVTFASGSLAFMYLPEQYALQVAQLNDLAQRTGQPGLLNSILAQLDEGTDVHLFTTLGLLTSVVANIVGMALLRRWNNIVMLESEPD